MHMLSESRLIRRLFFLLLFFFSALHALWMCPMSMYPWILLIFSKNNMSKLSPDNTNNFTEFIIIKGKRAMLLIKIQILRHIMNRTACENWRTWFDSASLITEPELSQVCAVRVFVAKACTLRGYLETGSK